MTSVGETLRRERLRTGLDLEKISRETKISVRMLQLIEADQFEKLPGGVFAKSFVRQYARAVGLEADEVIRELEKTLDPTAEGITNPDVIAKPEPDIRVPRVALWEEQPGGLRPGSSLPALAMVVLVIMACSAAYTWWQRPRTERPAAQQRPATAQQSATSQPLSVPSAPSPEPPVQPAAAVPAAPLEAGALTIALTAEEATWVQASANGKVVFSGILQPNESKSLSAANTMTLRIGNAGGLAISLNGKSIPAIGPKGQVRTVQLSPDGAVQVVAPAKVQTPPTAPAQETQRL